MMLSGTAAPSRQLSVGVADSTAGAARQPHRASDLYARLAVPAEVVGVNRTTGTKAVETVDIDRAAIWLGGEH